MKYIILIGLVALMLSCNQEEATKNEKGCSTLAVVRDLRGLDGCSFVFELADGKKLEPLLSHCVLPPIDSEPQKDPLSDFEFADGKQVRIGYEVLENQISICMAGTIVKISCIEEVAAPKD